MKTKEYLNEESYQNVKQKILKVSKLVLTVGILIGAVLIGIGIYKNYQIKHVYPEKIAQLEEQLNTKRAQLKNEIQPTLDEIENLENTKFEGFNDAYYERQKEISKKKEAILPIENQISEINLYFSINWCFNPTLTKEVCDLKEVSRFNNVPLFIGGSFLIIASLMISGAIYMTAKRREMMAFSLQ